MVGRGDDIVVSFSLPAGSAPYVIEMSEKPRLVMSPTAGKITRNQRKFS
jgi:hypothetical protein